MAQYTGLLDMINGGGAGKAGDTFEGGLFSELLNGLGIRPRGYADRLAEQQKLAAMQPTAPAQPYQRPQPTLPPTFVNPYAPENKITTTTLPPVGSMSNEDLIRLIQEGIARGQVGQAYRAGF